MWLKLATVSTLLVIQGVTGDDCTFTVSVLGVPGVQCVSAAPCSGTYYASGLSQGVGACPSGSSCALLPLTPIMTCAASGRTDLVYVNADGTLTKDGQSVTLLGAPSVTVEPTMTPSTTSTTSTTNSATDSSSTTKSATDSSSTTKSTTDSSTTDNSSTKNKDSSTTDNSSTQNKDSSTTDNSSTKTKDTSTTSNTSNGSNVSGSDSPTKNSDAKVKEADTSTKPLDNSLSNSTSANKATSESLYSDSRSDGSTSFVGSTYDNNDQAFNPGTILSDGGDTSTSTREGGLGITSIIGIVMGCLAVIAIAAGARLLKKGKEGQLATPGATGGLEAYNNVGGGSGGMTPKENVLLL